MTVKAIDPWVNVSMGAMVDTPFMKKVKVMGNERVTAGGLIKRAKVRASSVKKKAQG